MPKIAFVSNFCPHYRVGLYEEIGRSFETDFLFYSKGKEWYWQTSHGIYHGDFNFEYLDGFSIGKTRITPSLPIKLSKGKYDIIIKCINGKFAIPITYLIARIRRKPFILWTGIWQRLETRIHKLIFPLTLYIYRHADAIVVYGSHVKEYLICEGVDEKKIFIAPHAVDNKEYQRQADEQRMQEIRKELQLPEDKKIVLYLGRLEESKGLIYLVDAFSQLNRPDTLLIIAGNGSELPSIKQKVEQFNIKDNVRFAGYVNIQNTIEYYDLADIFVLPSISVKEGREPWGLTINEVFNRSIPVIVSDMVGAAAGGLVEDKVNGLIVKEKSASELAYAMNDLLDNPQKIKEYGKNARQRIEQQTFKEMADGFFQAIASVRQN